VDNTDLFLYRFASDAMVAVRAEPSTGFQKTLRTHSVAPAPV
jgi:hypothetical protein